MKIHIVQKGDTLWSLAEKYGVDFEHLKQVNGHLANPDLLMPGMKIKIPTTAVPVKKEAVKGKIAPVKKAVPMPQKEMPKEIVKPQEMMIKEEIKAKVEELDLVLLKDMVKKAAPKVLKQLLEEAKPEVIQQIQIEIEMKQNQELEVKMTPQFTPQQVEPYTPTMPKPAQPYYPLAPQLGGMGKMMACPPVMMPPCPYMHHMMPVHQSGYYQPIMPPVKEMPTQPSAMAGLGTYGYLQGKPQPFGWPAYTRNENEQVIQAAQETGTKPEAGAE